MKDCILALDTSHSIAFCALELSSSGERLSLRSDQIPETGRLSNSVSILVERLFKQAAIEPSNLSALIIGSGPGSFTGLRIGYSFMKGLALARGLSLQSCSSFLAAALALSDKGFEQLAVVSDARREELFFGLYQLKPGGEVQAAPCIIKKTELSQKLSAAIGGAAKLGLLNLSPELRLDSGFPEVQQIPNLALGLLQKIKLEQGRHFADKESKGLNVRALSQLSPQYVRAVSARSIVERGAK